MLIALRFYVPPNTKSVILEMFFAANLGLVLKNWNRHNKRKHASTTKCTTT